MTSDDSQNQITTIPQATLTAYFLVIGILWVSSFFPEARLWGMNWYQYFGWPGRILLLVAGLVAPWLWLRWSESAAADWATSPGDSKFTVWTLVTTLTFGLVFTLLSSRTHFLGDGYQVLAKVQGGIEAVKPWDGAIWTVQTAVYALFGGAGEASARPALQAISITSGLMFLGAALAASRLLFTSLRDRWLFVLSLATGGYMLLFFGYIENYPLFVLAVALFGLTGLLVSRAGWSRWTILFPLGLALVLHPFGVALVPPAGYLIGRAGRLGRRLSGWSTQLKLAGLGIMAGSVLATVGYLWQISYFFRFSLVPPVADRFTVEGYTLFSPAHLLDYANLLVMLCPGLPVALALATRLPIRAILSRPEYRFVGLLTSTCLVATFIFNPRLGMPRDWDLFAFAGVPLVLLATMIALERRSGPQRRLGSGLLVVSGLLVLGPRVVSQVVPEVSIAVFDHFADLDVIKSRNGRFLLQKYLERQGRMVEHDRRALINAAVLPHERLSSEGQTLGEEGYLPEAVAKFKQAIKYDPTYHYAWANLGVVYRWLDQFDSALTCLRIADGLNPYSFSTYMKLAGTYSGAGDKVRAEAYWRRAARLKTDDLECREYLLSLYREQIRWADFDALLSELVGRDSLTLGILTQAARRQLEVGDSAGAAASCLQALDLGLDTALVLELQDEFPQLRLLGFDRASGPPDSSR